MTTRRQFMQTVGAGLALAVVPGAALGRSKGLPLERMTAVYGTDSFEPTYKWMPVKRSELRRGDHYAEVRPDGMKDVHLAGDSFPQRTVEEGAPLKDPNVRKVEVLVLSTDGWLDCYENTEYSEEHGVLTLTCAEGFEPLSEPMWMPWEWPTLDPHMVFRIREPDGTLEAGPMDVCVALAPAKKTSQGIWSVKVGPLKHIEVMHRLSDNHLVLRDYSATGEPRPTMAMFGWRPPGLN